jgi:predicted O-linked N-acetylglucosamine transferase (SPINDLY family)/predicted 2-oxoglutarate/Fe(II)-dependent dioxygenase YbiX
MKPTHATCYSLGLALIQQGALSDAIEPLQQALALQPEALDICYNLAIALQKLHRWDDALQQYQKLLHLAPDLLAAHQQIGNVLQKQGRYPEAIDHYQQAIAFLSQPEKMALAINQTFAVRPEVIWYNLGVALQASYQPDADHAYRQALALRSQYGEAYHALGAWLESQQRWHEAIDHYQQALQILPHDGAIWINLGNLQVRQKQWSAAEQSFRQALQINPESLKAIEGVLKVHMQTCQWSEWQALSDKIWEIGQHSGSEIALYNTLFLPLSPAQQQVLARNHGQTIAQKVQVLRSRTLFTFPHPRHSSRLRLGYVSGDYRNQAVAYLIDRLFELHDRQRFEVFAYSLGEDDGKDYRQKFERESDCFRDFSQMAVETIVQQIYDDRIDILIDLEGYTQYAKPEVYALKPAPLIVSYLGHLGTMGLNEIDYVITDPVTVPINQAQWLTEQPIYLPEHHTLTSDQQPIAPFHPRSHYGLPANHFIFCGWHKVQKLEPSMFATWMRILQRVPHSILWLQEVEPLAIANLRATAEKLGVTGDRLIFAPPLPKSEHLARCQCADLFLDTRYHSAAATGVDVLWTGLPLLTLAGDTFAARLCASLLTAAGLPELIASSLEDYENLAVQLATQPSELQTLRQKLVEGRSQSALFNTARTIRHLEFAYQQIWQTYEAGHAPQPVTVPPLCSLLPDSAMTFSSPLPVVPFASLCIEQVLTTAELSAITEQLDRAEFIDGKFTAGKFAAHEKHNLQLHPDQAIAPELSAKLVGAIARNFTFQQAFHPKIIRQPLFSRYEPGMSYGDHVDAAIMGQPPIRSDLSITVFLNDPDSYEGGELVLSDRQSIYPIKLSAGSMIVYPSLYLHRVNPVSRGVRLVAVTWVQSLIRDAGDRAILFDLCTSWQRAFAQYGKTPEFDLIVKSHENLLRKWAEL